MALLDANGRSIPAADIARARAAANADSPRTGFANAYDAASHNGAWLSGWRPGIMSPDREYLPGRDPMVARVRDLVRNEPIAGAALSRRKNSAVGRGWRLVSKPDARALGITPEQARELASQIQSEFRMYAYGHAFQSDAARRLNFGQQTRLAAHQLMGDGEGLGLVEWAADENTRYKTRLRIVDPDRLSNPQGRINDLIFRGGIEHDAAEVPIRYWLRQAHPGDFVGASMAAYTWLPFDRFTAWGRPQVLHWMDPERASQSRGVTRFASTLKAFRAFAKFTDATLQNATINALFAAFVQSSAGPEAVSESLTVDDLVKYETERETFYSEHPVALGGDARIPVLPLGDEIKMATAARDVTSFDGFVRAIIRLIASALGVTYEELSMDYSQTNYSSARAALIHAAAETDAMRATLEAQLVRPFYVAWLEEAFDRGYIVAPPGAPDFYDAVDAYAGARWIGPKRGYIDPTKEILAAAARIEAGVSTLEDECADDGKDWEEVQDQRLAEEVREMERRKELGLPPRGADALAQAAEDTKNAFREAPPAPPPSANSPLHRIAAFADSPGHEAFLDARMAPQL